MDSITRENDAYNLSFDYNVPYSFNHNVCKLYICGVAAMMKTSCCKKLKFLNYNVAFHDFAEQVDNISEFSKKASDPFLQMMYTLKVITQTNKYPNKMCIFDRSPISDWWYYIIFNILPKVKAIETKHNKIQALETLAFEQLSEFLYPMHSDEIITQKQILGMELTSKYRTIFIYPDYSYSDTVLQKMKIRQNGLDILTEDYVLAQTAVFKVLHEKFNNIKNFIFYKIEGVPELYSDYNLNNIVSFIRYEFKNIAQLEYIKSIANFKYV